jgi:hypothetical protein
VFFDCKGRASKLRPFFLGNSTSKRVRGTVIRNSQSVKKIVSTFAILYRVPIESQQFDKNPYVEMLRTNTNGEHGLARREKEPNLYSLHRLPGLILWCGGVKIRHFLRIRLESFRSNLRGRRSSPLGWQKIVRRNRKVRVKPRVFRRIKKEFRTNAFRIQDPLYHEYDDRALPRNPRFTLW